MSLESPSHRAALRFGRGGLIAVVALLLPSQFGIVSRDAPALAPLVALFRILVPAIGFALGGAVGGSAIGRGRRGVVACAAGLFITGIGAALIAPQLLGLTGFENAATVLVFAGVATGAAFAAGGAIVAILLEPRRTASVVAGFLAGGAAGGVVTVLPAVFAAPLAGLPGELQLFVRLGCSLVGLIGPFAVAGAVTARAAGEGTGR